MTEKQTPPEESDKGTSMALVLWTYNNPRVDRRSQETQHFTINGQTLEILQEVSADINVNQNTGLKLWDGAYLLAKYLENEIDFPKNFWCGKRCVELGAGCGLVGMSSWLLGADVILTDIKDMLVHTNKCLERNKENLQGFCDISKIKSLPLWWGSDCKDLDPAFDVILGSDIIYQKDCVEVLLQSLCDLSAKDTLIYITYKPRGLGEEVFFDKLHIYGFQCKTIPNEKHPIEFQGTDYRILKITLV